MGGTLKLNSEVDAGSSFIFIIPVQVDERVTSVSVPVAAASSTDSTLAEQLEGLRVLLVEDNATTNC